MASRNAPPKPKKKNNAPAGAGRPKGSLNKDQNVPKVKPYQKAYYEERAAKIARDKERQAQGEGNASRVRNREKENPALEVHLKSKVEKAAYLAKRKAKAREEVIGRAKKIIENKKVRAAATKKADKRVAAGGSRTGGVRPGAGAKPIGERAMTAAERQRKSRAAKKELVIKHD